MSWITSTSGRSEPLSGGRSSDCFDSAAIAVTGANQTSASDDQHFIQGEARDATSNSSALTCTAATRASVPELVSIPVHYRDPTATAIDNLEQPWLSPQLQQLAG